MEAQQKAATPEQRALVNYLRGKNGPKVRSGLLNGKRTDYFKGKTAIKVLLSEGYKKQKKCPQVANEEEAARLLHSIIPCAFYLRVQRSPEGSPRTLQINPQQAFPVEGLDYYAWFYEGSQFWTMVGGVGMVVIMLAGVMFPLWPYTLRLGVWYLSMGVLGLLGAFFAMAILRLIFYVITLVVASPGIWVFPRLFEDVSFVDSWIPLWAWDVPAKKGKKAKKASGEKSSKKEKASSGVSSALGSVAGSAEGLVQQAGKATGARIEEIADEDA